MNSGYIVVVHQKGEAKPRVLSYYGGTMLGAGMSNLGRFYNEPVAKHICETFSKRPDVAKAYIVEVKYEEGVG